MRMPAGRSSVSVLSVTGTEGLLAVSACGRDQPPQVGTATIAVAEREALPPVAGTTLEGTSLDLADLRGRVVVLNSWASWCSPCRDEIPDFVALADASPAGALFLSLELEMSIPADIFL